MLIIVSLVFTLTSSSFFLPGYLEDEIVSGRASQEQIDYAISLGLDVAFEAKRNQAEVGSQSWLKWSQQLALSKGSIASELAGFYLGEGNSRRAIFWYQKAIALGDKEANLSLATHYYLEENFKAAIPYLTPVLDREQALVLRIKIALAQGELAFIRQHIGALSVSEIARELLAALYYYQVLDKAAEQKSLSVLKSSESEPLYLPGNQYKGKQCPASIQLFATTHEDLEHAESLVKEIASHPLSPYICFAPVRYIPRQELSCRFKPEHAIKCNEESWQKLAQEIDTRYLGLVLPRGGANVHLGMLYLDRQDSAEVFAHELSHLLGFIDEYPLPKRHAKCDAWQSEPFAHNIAIIDGSPEKDKNSLRQELLKQIPWRQQIKSSTPILNKTASGWQLGTPAEYSGEIGLFASDTCKGRKVQAYKPLAQPTQLTYFELEFPALYVDTLKTAPEQYLMPSFHYNIAFSLFKAGQIEQAKYWLSQAAAYESEPNKKAKILNGEF